MASYSHYSFQNSSINDVSVDAFCTFSKFEIRGNEPYLYLFLNTDLGSESHGGGYAMWGVDFDKRRSWKFCGCFRPDRHGLLLNSCDQFIRSRSRKIRRYHAAPVKRRGWREE